jgi:hypothetical protein
MKNNKKIIDKVCKCLRLSESGNPNEAAAALRQAMAMMEKYGISDAEIRAADVSESIAEVGESYNPPFWAMALANLIGEAFQCRSLISRRFGRRPEFRFIGMGYNPKVATYSYLVLVRSLQRAVEEFGQALADSNVTDVSELQRRKDVFVQAWVFRAGRTVFEFLHAPADKVIIDEYIQQKYGETAEFIRQPAETQDADYDDILSGLRAANEIELYRSVECLLKPEALQHRRAS